MVKTKVCFLHTLTPGITYWRFITFLRYMKLDPEFEFVLFPEFDPNQREINRWEERFGKDNDFRKMVCAVVGEADILITQTVHTLPALSLMDALVDQGSRKNNCKVLVDVDDYFFAVPEDHLASSRFYPGSDVEEIQKKQMMSAYGLIVSTPYLKQMFAPFNSNIEVIPNAIDFEDWRFRVPRHTGMRIGWSGGMQHRKDLFILRDIIPGVCNLHKGTKFVIMGGHPEVFMGEPYATMAKEHVEGKPWTKITDYPKAYAKMACDVIISPLSDNLLNRAKSNLKWLEASAYKIPFIGSRIEPYKSSIVSGNDGMLATSLDDWVAILDRLISEKRFRKELGETAYRVVRDKWNAKKVAEKYLRHLRLIRDLKYRNTYNLEKRDPVEALPYS